MAKPISITVVENGPLKLSSEEMRLQAFGEPIELGGVQDVFLCRCGESKSAPFCDGSHAAVGFEGESPARESKEIRVWEGRTLRTFFNSNVCMHVFYCKPLKELRERELAGDDAAAEEIARIVQSCPSGALSFESQEVSVPAPEQRPDVEIIEGGEVRVQSVFEINAPLNARQTPDRVTLCRCGQSKNKPWCDGRHKKREGFR